MEGSSGGYFNREIRMVVTPGEVREGRWMFRGVCFGFVALFGGFPGIWYHISELAYLA